MTALGALFATLALSALGLVSLAWTSRRPISGATFPRDIAGYAQTWKDLHHAHDIDPLKSPLHVAYLRVTYGAASPLARLGVLPDVLTLLGLWLAGLVVALGWSGGRWPIAGGAVMIISSLTDGVDGAVAGLTARSTARGHVLDSVIDRFSEVCFVAAVVLAGAPAWAGVLAMAGVMTLEYTRARAASAGSAGWSGSNEVGVITVGERPTRVIGCALALVGMGVAPRSTEFIGRNSLIIVAVASFIGFAQLAWFIARRYQHL